MYKEHPQSLFVMLNLLLDTLWETKIAIENGRKWTRIKYVFPTKNGDTPLLC